MIYEIASIIFTFVCVCEFVCACECFPLIAKTYVLSFSFNTLQLGSKIPLLTLKALSNSFLFYSLNSRWTLKKISDFFLAHDIFSSYWYHFSSWSYFSFYLPSFRKEKPIYLFEHKYLTSKKKTSFRTKVFETLNKKGMTWKGEKKNCWLARKKRKNFENE